MINTKFFKIFIIFNLLFFFTPAFSQEIESEGVSNNEKANLAQSVINSQTDELHKSGLKKMSEGNFEGAFEDYTEALSILENNHGSKDELFNLYRDRGTLRFAQKDFQNALRDYDAAGKYQKNDAQIAAYRALCYLGLNDKKTAKKYYKRAVKSKTLDPDTARELESLLQ